jgi:hypothetical protein
LVTIGVVDALEVVDVEHHERVAGAAPQHTLVLGFQPVRQFPPVEQASQHIGDRHFLERVGQFLQAPLVGVADAGQLVHAGL